MEEMQARLTAVEALLTFVTHTLLAEDMEKRVQVIYGLQQLEAEFRKRNEHDAVMETVRSFREALSDDL